MLTMRLTPASLAKPDVGVSIKIPHGFSDRKWWAAHAGCLKCNMYAPCRQHQFTPSNLLL